MAPKESVAVTPNGVSRLNLPTSPPTSERTSILLRRVSNLTKRVSIRMCTYERVYVPVCVCACACVYGPQFLRPVDRVLLSMAPSAAVLVGTGRRHPDKHGRRRRQTIKASPFCSRCRQWRSRRSAARRPRLNGENSDSQTPAEKY